MRYLLLSLIAFLAVPAVAKAPPGPAAAGLVRVRFTTSAGAFVIAVDTRHAPKSSATFLTYVDDGRFDGTNFFRASRRKDNPRMGLVEGGIGTDARRVLPSVALEPTSMTGLHHTDGAVSLAHGADPNSGGGNFSIMLGPNPALDAHGASRGYAVFGRVLSGMDVVRRILAMPTGGGSGAMKGQMLTRPVRIVTAQRLDGVAHPTGHAKPWLIGLHY